MLTEEEETMKRSSAGLVSTATALLFFHSSVCEQRTEASGKKKGEGGKNIEKKKERPAKGSVDEA